LLTGNVGIAASAAILWVGLQITAVVAAALFAVAALCLDVAVEEEGEAAANDDGGLAAGGG
jgi:hypothetical protein